MPNLVRNTLSAVASCLLVAASFTAVLQLPTQSAFAAAPVAAPILA